MFIIKNIGLHLAVLSFFSEFTLAYHATIDTINATYPNSPTPFKINVDPQFISSTKKKAALFRYTKTIDGLPDGEDGPSAADAKFFRDYWTNEYNWTAVQSELNSFWTQFTTTVNSSGTTSNYTEPVPLHFIHHRSPRADAIPFLFIHGWPGSFLEIGPAINNLTNPSDPSQPAFHVVAPSIPGFAFSPAPIKDGYGPIEAAHTFHVLMQKLGYTKYVMQGGDLGAFICRHQAVLYPDSVVSILSNFWLISPTQADLERYSHNQTTADETVYLKNVLNYVDFESGYRYVQTTAPLQLAWGMTDSPVGNLLWNWGLAKGISASKYVWTAGEFITWSMMYFIQGPYAGFRMYKEFAQDGDWSTTGSFFALPYVKVPIGVTQRPLDIGWRLPLDWARRDGNVTALYQHEYGGHFAAYQTPKSFVEDCWNFFGNASVSNTGIFGRS